MTSSAGWTQASSSSRRLQRGLDARRGGVVDPGGEPDQPPQRRPRAAGAGCRAGRVRCGGVVAFGGDRASLLLQHAEVVRPPPAVVAQPGQLVAHRLHRLGGQAAELGARIRGVGLPGAVDRAGEREATRQN